MAYGLKYSQWTGKDDARVLVQVYVKDWAGRAYGMAHLTGASLQIVGGQSDVLTPVIKTAFSFSLVDAWDEGTTQADGTTCVNAMYEKCGEWEEFFTPDATKFKVVVSAAASGQTASPIWTGYVTPDSWSEDLIYHGAVTITARDMLGSLTDAEFDLTGRVSILDIVAGALSACSCPMPLTYDAGHFLVNSNGQTILRHNIVANTFSGDTWLRTLEDALDSLGLALRWNGHNEMVLTSLRYLAADTLDDYHEMEFVSRSGLRELSPALKSITETFDIEKIDFIPQDPAASQMTDTGSTITCGSGDYTGVVKKYTFTRSGGEGWAGTLGCPMYGTAEEGTPIRGLYIPCSAPDPENNLSAVYQSNRLTGGFYFSFSLSGGCLVRVVNGGTNNAVFSPWTSGVYGITHILIRVQCTQSGTANYLNSEGVWTTEQTYLSVEIGEETYVPVLNGAENYQIVVNSPTMGGTGRPVAPLLAPLELTISPNKETVETTEYKTTMEYDLTNNVTIERSPVLGSASVAGAMDFYGNVLAYNGTCAANEWNWPGEASYYPLAVMIQAQVVVYHSAPASIFTGTAHDKDNAALLALPGHGLDYYNRECVIVSGTYDFASGFLAQLNAREVYAWEDVWGTFAPTYTIKRGAAKGSTSDTGAWGGGATSTPAGDFSLAFDDDFSVTE